MPCEGSLRRASSIRLLLAAGLLTLSTAAAASSVKFELVNHGTLTLAVPDGWKSELKQPPNQLPPTIILKPSEGHPGEVFITAVWPVSPERALPDDATLRSQVARAAKQLESQSVEGTLPLTALNGKQGHGFYFTATDRAPKPGEYSYMLQGLIRVGDIALAFTLLTNGSDSPLVNAVLNIVRTADYHANNLS
jgi:hypothetical protein